METQETHGKSGRTASRIAALLGAAFSFEAAMARAQAIVEFDVPSAASAPQFITAGPDGNLWFTESEGNRIGRITPDGSIVEFELPNTGSVPWRITTGPDGALWFTEMEGNRIGRMNVEGGLNEWDVPTPKSLPFGIAAGPDGALWFTEREGNRIGRIDVSGNIEEFGLAAHTGPNGIALGPDGALWFAEQYAGRAGRITTDGQWTESSPFSSSGYPFGVASAAGYLWVTTTPGGGGSLVRVAPGGGAPAAHPVTDYTPGDPAADSAGNIWYAESDAKISRFGPGTQIRTWTVPTATADPTGIAIGPDGKIWFTEAQSGKIGRLDPAAAAPGPTCTAPAAPALQVDGGPSAHLSAGTAFTLQWTDTLGGGSGQYMILSSPSGLIAFAPVATTGGTSQTLTASAANAGTTLLFEVRATRNCGTSSVTGASSGTVTVTIAGTSGPPPPPPPPPPPATGCTPNPHGRPCVIVPAPPTPVEIDRSR